MAAMESSIRLARTLDPRLLRFFTRFPPAQLQSAPSQPPPAPSIQIAENTSPMDPNAAVPTSPSSTAPSETPKSLLGSNPNQSATNQKRKHNPFLPYLNPSTGNWHSPHYSLRRQAVLYKLAQQHNVLSLMPIAPKHPEIKAQRRLEQGIRVKGTGVGESVKGKKWERTLPGRLETRRQAMEGMPKLIRLWKRLGHGRGWKNWPKPGMGRK